MFTSTTRYGEGEMNWKERELGYLPPLDVDRLL